MARTSLFTSLSKVFTRLTRERRAETALGRREFLGLSALAAGALVLPACGDDDGGGDAGPGGDGGAGGNDGGPEPGDDQVQVAVLGAGLAGLHAAYRLQQAGIDVRVYEAAKRVGGRTFTLRDAFPDGQLAELGGELIDSNHVAMFQLAEELGLTLDDRLQPGVTADVWWVNGAAVPEETVVAQFSAVAGRMLDDLEAADSDEDRFAELDETSLADYLDEVVPADEFPELHAILVAAYRGEFGLEPAEQSALNLIYLIGSDEPDPFRVFGESDERYHLHEGNDSIARKLAERLGDAVVTEHRCTRIASDGSRLVVDLERADGTTRSVSAEHVVVALPFTVLRDIELAVDISDEKRRIIAELGYGTNTKLMGAFSERVWLTRHESSGSVTSDEDYQQTWDSSIGQAGDHGILTNFLGGEQGARAVPDPEALFTAAVDALEAVFPGIRSAYVADSARAMHWPTYPLVRASYTCYRPGQWSFWQLEGQREGNIHFCGEHTSPDFQGWMEGAAETGAFAAAEILDDLGVAYPAALAALLSEKLPQPTWRLESLPSKRLSLLTRRRSLGRSALARARSQLRTAPEPESLPRVAER